MDKLFDHNKTKFDNNFKKLDIYVDQNQIRSYETTYDYGFDNDMYQKQYYWNERLKNIIIARNSYNMSLLLSNRLLKLTDHICWLPSELWNIITNFIKVELIDQINNYKNTIPRTITIKRNFNIGNYDYSFIMKADEDGSIKVKYK